MKKSELPAELVERLTAAGIQSPTENAWRCTGEVKEDEFRREGGVWLAACFAHDPATQVRQRRFLTEAADVLIGQCEKCGAVLWSKFWSRDAEKKELRRCIPMLD